jgi:signal peptidase
VTETDTHATPDALPRRVWRAAVSVVFWVAVAAAAWLLWPTSLGGCTTLTIVSGRSMEPTYVTGDLVVARCGQPVVGDVVVYEPPGLGGGRIIHRLIGGDGASGWQVQGDNNTWVDPYTPTNADVLGIARVHVPKLGMFATVLATPYVWVSLIVIALAVLVWPRDDEDEESTDDDTDGEDTDDEPHDGGSDDEPLAHEPALVPAAGRE